MKIYPLSNLHVNDAFWRERQGVAVPCAGADVVVVAGDVLGSLESIDFLERIDAPVVLVMGNHDYWRSGSRRLNVNFAMDMDVVIDQVRRRVAGGNVTLLERDEVVIDGVRFLGGTMWSDVAGLSPLAISCGWAMNDFKNITARSAWRRFSESQFSREILEDAGDNEAWRGQLEHSIKAGLEYGMLNPVLTAFLHDEFVRWLKERTAVAFDGPTVVVTHHAPSRASLRGVVFEDTFSRLDSKEESLRFSDDASSICGAAYFCSSDERLLDGVRGKVSLWIQGSGHRCLDYANSGVRVVCNPVELRSNVVNKGNGLERPFLIDPSTECQDLIDDASSKAFVEFDRITADMARFAEHYGSALAGVEREALAESIHLRTAKLAEVYREWVSRLSGMFESKRGFMGGSLDGLIPGYGGLAVRVLEDCSSGDPREALSRIYETIGQIRHLLKSTCDLVNVRRKYLYQCVQYARKAMDNGGYDFKLTCNPDGGLFSDLWIRIDIKSSADLDLEKTFNLQDELNLQLRQFLIELGPNGLDVVANPKSTFSWRRGVDLILMVDGEEYFYEPNR